MEWRYLKALAFFVLIGMFSCGGGKGVKIGQQALDFELQDLQGKTYRLSDYRGQIVHLHFWADWCPRCDEEFDRMERAYKDLKEAHPDFEILAVNVDQPRVHVEEFVKRHGVTFPVLLDVGAKVARSYGVKGLPCNFLIDKNGVVREVILGWIDEEYLAESIEKIGS